MDNTKTCKICLQTLDKTDFYKSTGRVCKECHKSAVKANLNDKINPNRDNKKSISRKLDDLSIKINEIIILFNEIKNDIKEEHITTDLNNLKIANDPNCS